MGSTEGKRGTGPITFACQWIGIAVVVVFLIAVVAGLLRDDVAGTIGPVVMWGMLISAVVIVGALFQRERRS